MADTRSFIQNTDSIQPATRYLKRGALLEGALSRARVLRLTLFDQSAADRIIPS